MFDQPNLIIQNEIEKYERERDLKDIRLRLDLLYSDRISLLKQKIKVVEKPLFLMP